jgi:CBS domain-containing protein
MSVNHEFFRVGRLIPDEQAVCTVAPGTTVAEALSIMQKRGFNQLPVVAGDVVIGVFSYRSLAHGLREIRKQDDPLGVAVDDLVEDLPFVRLSDDVGNILASLEEHGVVLVGDERGLYAVATASDVTTFLWNATRPFVLLQDIELALRELMRSCVDGEDLVEVIKVGAPNARVNRAGTVELRDLTLSELLSVLLNGPSYSRYFSEAFGTRREITLAQLDPTREVRNKVFHFRDDVTAEELQVLVAAVSWLRRKVHIRGSRPR